ncbi:ABC transporter permease [Rhodobacter sp. SGA-6-6]|uniref:ABC transporter permease n=1 Tax=Rhodobacter sp. SGA-6-6 TaxID=2710882 RepID=UPI00197ED11A|nr:ABC transporter permease [Rhodobacter sp. SGA-6-6]
MNRLPLPWRIAANMATAAVLAFLVAPILAVIPASFNKASFIYLPPKEWSALWYGRFFDDAEWLRALMNSLKLATLATLVAVPLGTLAAIGLSRAGRGLALASSALFLAPMVVPIVVVSVAIYRSALDVSMNGTLLALTLSHAVLALPFVVINVGISLRAVNPAWPLAAAGLGAGPWRIFRTITLPVILPGIAGGAVFSFMTSFDEAVLTIFLADHSTKTLPVKLWETVRLEFTPVLAVAAVVMIGLSVALFVLAQALARRNGEKA